MRTLTIVCATLLGTAPAFAQVRVEVMAPPPPRIQVVAPPPPRIVVPAPPRVQVYAPPPPAVRVQAPTIRFAAPPPMVVVEPGIQVVEDADEEVFFVDGYYWHPGADGRWYRTNNYRGGWVMAPAPSVLVRMPRGHYRHYHGDHERWKAEKRAEHEARREQKHDKHGRR